MAFDLHVFTDRDGKPCVSVTDNNNVRSRPIRINAVVGRYLLKAAIACAVKLVEAIRWQRGRT